MIYTVDKGAIWAVQPLSAKEVVCMSDRLLELIIILLILITIRDIIKYIKK